MTRQEAIDKVYGMIGTAEQHEALDFLVPEIRELRESYDRQQEDKRIIQNLIDAFTEYKKSGGVDFHGIEINTLLAWIEKQKEQKPLKSIFPPGLGEAHFNPISVVEQKPVDYEAELKKCKDNPLYFYDKYVSIKQKPAEWGEEDEKMLKSIDLSLDCYSEGQLPALVMQISREREWLKSLRPSWKPSEEQMEALDKAIPVCMGVAGRDEIAPLESLYEQLKKLM